MVEDNQTEARDLFVEKIDEQLNNGCEQWMGVFFRVQDGKITLGARTTVKFPMGDALAAIGLLAGNLHELMLGMDKDPLKDKPPALKKFNVANMKPFVADDPKPPQSPMAFTTPCSAPEDEGDVPPPQKEKEIDHIDRNTDVTSVAPQKPWSGQVGYIPSIEEGKCLEGASTLKPITTPEIKEE